MVWFDWSWDIIIITVPLIFYQFEKFLAVWHLKFFILPKALKKLGLLDNRFLGAAPRALKTGQDQSWQFSNPPNMFTRHNSLWKSCQDVACHFGHHTTLRLQLACRLPRICKAKMANSNMGTGCLHCKISSWNHNLPWKCFHV
jgi:hypothetical protein